MDNKFHSATGEQSFIRDEFTGRRFYDADQVVLNATSGLGKTEYFNERLLAQVLSKGRIESDFLESRVMDFVFENREGRSRLPDYIPPTMQPSAAWLLNKSPLSIAITKLSWGESL